MRGSRPALLLAAAAVLLLVVLVARGESAVPGRTRDVSIELAPLRPTVTQPTRQATEAPGLQYSANDPALFAKVVVGLVGVLLLLAVVLSTLSWLRNRRRDSIAVGDVPEHLEGSVDTVMRLRLREAVTRARDQLARESGEPRDAVIRAWVTLENATEHGRAPHETATEFTVSLLAKETADPDALRELRTLYHRARFGHHSAESHDREADSAEGDSAESGSAEGDRAGEDRAARDRAGGDQAGRDRAERDWAERDAERAWTALDRILATIR